MSDAAPWEDYKAAAPAANDVGPWNDYKPAPRVGWAEENLAGPTEVIGSTLANVPHAAAHAAVDLYHRLTFNADAPNETDSLSPFLGGPVPMGQGGQQLLGDIKSTLAPPADPNSADAQIDAYRAKVLGPRNATVDDVIKQTGQVVNDAMNLAPVAGGATSLVRRLAADAPEATIAGTAQEAANRAASSGNAGAAGTAVDTTKLTPETQAELASLGSRGSTPNATALGRIHEAESLPVPVRLTAGQARGDAGMISEEFNLKGQDNNAIGNRYDEQDQALKDNLTTMHREAAPDTVANNSIQNGQAVLDSLKRYDEPKVAEINAAYKAAKDANGGDLQMDGAKFVHDAEAALKPQGRMRSLPAVAQGILEDVKAAGGKMSLDDFEGYRSQLAAEARAKAADGNAVAAINKVRDALEATQPADSASASAKSLYDKARTLAKNRFSEIDADPAYKAAVDDAAPIGQQSDLADKFSDKYVLGGSKAALQRLRMKLDVEGGHAMTSSAMNFLQNKAGINLDTGAGKFSNAGYNAGLAKIMPRANELLADQDLIDNTRRLGNVSNYSQSLSRGSYANTSHTFVAEKAAEVAEHAINTAAKGLPVGTIARKFLASRSKAAASREALKPGAGLED